VRFYLGTHEPGWLARVDVPLMVSRHRLERRARPLPVAATPWVLDSGGFTELGAHGRWTFTARTYAADVARYRETIGHLDWAAPMDWMCEAHVLAKTGLTVVEHQARTVGNVLELRALEVPVIPVLQGADLADYHACADRYEAAGIALEAEPVVGLGSVCRRQATPVIGGIVIAMADRGYRLHGFGCKQGALIRYGAWMASADSLAWSRGGKSRGTCTHLRSRCANHLHWALDWRAQVMAAQLGANVQQAWL